jgi:hypothetical protein
LNRHLALEFALQENIYTPFDHLYLSIHQQTPPFNPASTNRLPSFIFIKNLALPAAQTTSINHALPRKWHLRVINDNYVIPNHTQSTPERSQTRLSNPPPRVTPTEFD